MSQHDFDIANASGATVRSDINAALVALAELSTGASAPATTKANMFWFDTTNGVLNKRNNANTAWITPRDETGIHQVDTGTADAMVITPSPAYTAYAAGQHFLVKKAASNNTGAATLKVSALTPIAVKDHFGNDLTAGDLQGSEAHHVVYNGTNFVLMGFVASGFAGFPAATAMLFYQAAAPIYWTKDATATDQLVVLKEDSGGTTAGTLSPITGTPETTEDAGAHDHSAATGLTAINTAQLAAHRHKLQTLATGVAAGAVGWHDNAGTSPMGVHDLDGTGPVADDTEPADTGSGSTHSHTINNEVAHAHSFGLLDFKRRHVILATKD